MAKIPRNRIPEFYTSITTHEDLIELSENFKEEYKIFIRNYIMDRGYNRHDLFDGWFFNDELFVRISCNKNYNKLYFSFYDCNLQLNKEEVKIYKKHHSLVYFYNEFDFTISPNQEGYLQLSSRTFHKKLPKNLFNHLKVNLKKGVVENKDKKRKNEVEIVEKNEEFIKNPLVHRLITAFCLIVGKESQVHHLNHNRKDNNFKNLVVTNVERHNEWHDKHPNMEIASNFDPLNFEVNYVSRNEIEAYWQDEIEAREKAYNITTAKEEGNYAHKTYNDDVLFKICYYSYLKKLTNIEYRLVGLKGKGCLARGTVTKIKKKYINFIAYFVDKHREVY